MSLQMKARDYIVKGVSNEMNRLLNLCSIVLDSYSLLFTIRRSLDFGSCRTNSFKVLRISKVKRWRTIIATTSTMSLCEYVGWWQIELRFLWIGPKGSFGGIVVDWIQLSFF